MSEKKLPITIEPNQSAHQNIIVKVCKAHGVKSLELTTRHIALMSDSISEYIAQQPKQNPLLPADDAVQNWFEENIDKECSASSAIYKFRQWLESLQRKAITGAVWVRASEPGIKEGEYISKYRKSPNDAWDVGVSVVDATHIHFIEKVSYNIRWQKGHEELHNLFILDEIGTAAGREEDAVAFVLFCESRYSYVGDNKWDAEGDEMWTTDQLYELFKQQKEK